MENVRRQEVRELARLTAHLSCAQQTFFQAEYGRHRRNPTTALLLCVLLGDFGAHYFYFGRHRGGIVRLLFCWTLVPWILALFEARTITSRALRYNASLASELALAIEHADAERRASAEERDGAREAAYAPAQPVAPEPLDAEPEPVAARATAEAMAVPAALALVTVASSEPAEAAAGVDGALATEPEPVEQVEPVEPLARTPVAVDDVDDLDSAESHLIAAAWAGREPALDDPSDPPLPLEAFEPYTPANSASDTLDVRQDGTHETAEPLPWLVADETPRPAVSAAAALAAAAWTGATNEPAAAAPPDAGAAPEPAVQVTHAADATQAAEETPLEPPQEAAPAEAAETREPVFMYQIAAPPRRESVHVMPQPAQYHEEETVITAEPDASRDTSRRDELGLAAVGSALAAGLAELLRERPSRPRSPVTTPFGEPDEPVAPAQTPASGLALADESARRDAPAVAAEQTQPLGAAQPADASSEAAVPWQSDWTPTHVWVSDAHAASAQAAEQPMASSQEPVAEQAEWPAAMALASAGSMLHTGAHEAGARADTQAVQGSAMVSPADTYQSSRSRNLRRRVMQRVIVRKMAVLDGHVVGESTAERQVPVIPDEREMSARVQAATTEAAREALQYLMESAPEEVRPSIRMQLYALDTPASVQNVRAPAGSGGA